MRLFLFMFLLVLPLPLASARQSWLWLWVVSIGILAIWTNLGIRKSRRNKKAVLESIITTMLLITIAWAGLQAFLIESFLHIATLPSSIAASTSQTLAFAIVLLSHFLLLKIVPIINEHRQQGLALVRFVGVVVGVYALYGFIVFVTGNDHVLWYEKWASPGALTSTFVNRNSFAAYAGIGLQCLITYSFFWVRNEFASEFTGRRRIRHMLETMITRAWWLPLSIILVFTALLLTNSRAGFASTAIASFLLLLLSSANPQKEGGVLRRLSMPLLVLLVGGAIFALSGEVLEGRLQADAMLDRRFMAYPVIIDAIMERPWTGYGLGSFEDVWRAIRPQEFPGYWARAHSDYLELALTAGIPATLVFLSAFVAILVQLTRALKYGGIYRPFIALGISVIIQIGLHSLVDFPLQIPAVSYTWVAVIAASLMIAHRCQQEAKARSTRVPQ